MVKKLGFTLIEILVVIFIIAVTITFIGFGGGFYHSKDRQLQQAALEFKLLLEYAQHQAIFEFDEIGLSVARSGYRFMRFQINEEGENSGWKLIEDDSELGSYTLPSDINLQVEMSGSVAQNSTSPQIVFYSSGDLTPFSVDFSLANQAIGYRIKGEQNGKIDLVEIRNGL